MPTKPNPRDMLKKYIRGTNYVHKNTLFKWPIDISTISEKKFRDPETYSIK